MRIAQFAGDMPEPLARDSQRPAAMRASAGDDDPARMQPMLDSGRFDERDIKSVIDRFSIGHPMKCPNRQAPAHHHAPQVGQVIPRR